MAGWKGQVKGSEGDGRTADGEGRRREEKGGEGVGWEGRGGGGGMRGEGGDAVSAALRSSSAACSAPAQRGASATGWQTDGRLVETLVFMYSRHSVFTHVFNQGLNTRINTCIQGGGGRIQQLGFIQYFNYI